MHLRNMTPERFTAITGQYSRLSIAIAGDFCLDRYLEIDPARQETSLETGLPVYNVVNVRAQPGGAGTILNNLVALGMRAIFPVGFAGEDGEGHELRRALAQKQGVRLDHFVPDRRAPHVHLLQAAGAGARQSAARTEPAGPEELDRHTARPGRTSRRSP